MDSTPGIAYRQHLLSSVTHILVSGSQVVPLIQWSLKSAHVWLSFLSESMNNQLVSRYLTPSQLLCVHQKETACNCSKHKVANKKMFPNTILGSRFVSRSLVPLDKPGVTIRLVPLKGRAIASTVYNDDSRIVQQRFLSRVNRWLYSSIVSMHQALICYAFPSMFPVLSVFLSVCVCLSLSWWVHTIAEVCNFPEVAYLCNFLK